MKRVIAVGLAVMDKIFGVADLPREATKVFANSYREIGGGPAATAAVAVSRLGGQAGLWARVGEDAVGRRIIEELLEWGVAPCVRSVPGALSNVSGVLVDSMGERLIISYTDPGLDADPSWLPLEDLATADAVLVDVRWPQASAAVLKHARHLGVPTVLDADLAPDDVVQQLVPLADFAVFSKPALFQMSGVNDLQEALLRISHQTPGHVGVTIGQNGFAWLEGSTLQREPGFRVTVVDTLGAGDVFHGAFALALAEGNNIRKAAQFANGASALKCTRPGGRAGIPVREEVERLLITEGAV
ncbi:sugar kinase [Microvirga subterranea]|uniref:Sulfofructose kinase n=1 Tax=Microvirga subterranea TaxID=186651 RepID=A0A370H396_9HYPH|nr:sugar kinase [Microvirga subterranea]RDI50497.1 sulfofructose kinase [Microvirga subterranea]